MKVRVPKLTQEAREAMAKMASKQVLLRTLLIGYFLFDLHNRVVIPMIYVLHILYLLRQSTHAFIYVAFVTKSWIISRSTKTNLVRMMCLNAERRLMP